MTSGEISCVAGRWLNPFVHGKLAGIPFYELTDGWRIVEKLGPSFLDMLLMWVSTGSAIEQKPEILAAIEQSTGTKIPKHTAILSKEFEWTPKELDKIAETFKANGLPYTAMLFQEIAAAQLAGVRWADNFESWLPEISRRIQHELRSIVLMRIPQDKVRFFDEKPLFGPTVDVVFESIADDLRNAGRAVHLLWLPRCRFPR